MKVITGHLTEHDKKAIKAILSLNLTEGRVGIKNYFISLEGAIYTVKIKVKDRGLIPCPGSEFRISTYKHTFTI